MIDPLEVVIRYLLSQPTVTALVNNRVAAKHEYGSGWSVKTRAITLHLDGGIPDYNVQHQTIQMQARCYAEEPADAVALWRALIELSRATTNRPMVTTSLGNALLYWLLPASGPSLLYDPAVGLNMVIALFSANVAEKPL